MNEKKVTLWDSMRAMSTDITIPDKERILYLNAQASLDNGELDERIAKSLKRNLSRIAMEAKLSASGVQFLSQLSDLYMGYGRRDNLSL
ncbi:hypothetical protein [Pediococcus claussenii]|uniref:Enterocin A Immunity family protein n=1 Tax=Pediococcus claussenii (strain ATCC BAA-344 / DSM 14800 / JCM 18046 / KCTC 3811 / LMG 21948 / P06) TaxID=701521 RepID=G8PB29_PEDCP|nr:hypothetical protein [Pediococcus claussenii]AEV94658.1 hypothetical protein PECL_347 [Pediococcus claussenii ATCC BAA-344]ANZ69860.1 hypothetical protein AYR57_05855 [Pediococcus claussenii]ANZ71677.1 hypothetical protein AYR58_05860 [Pediococcus claussenii]KRN20838.1 hypothetical protein IV79_GL000058 [Pediococcus claussenii]